MGHELNKMQKFPFGFKGANLSAYNKYMHLK